MSAPAQHVQGRRDSCLGGVVVGHPADGGSAPSHPDGGDVRHLIHRGCGKFANRFGWDALRWVQSAVGSQLRLRGAFARVVEGGTGPHRQPGPQAPGLRRVWHHGRVLDAAKLLGLLTHPARRRVVAALILAADTREGLVARTGLPTRDVVEALGRLQAAGLVIDGADGTLVVLEEAFVQAARAVSRPAKVSEHPDAPPDRRRVLDASIRDGRLVRMPAKRSHRRILLEEVAQQFEVGRHYTEREVNAALAPLDDDTATLRRYLVDEGLMDRSDGTYWRCGGSYMPG